MKNRDILDSWKEIATYLDRSEKTCRRLEKELGLPVHRLEDSPKARVFAYKDEIDLWVDEILKPREKALKEKRKKYQVTSNLKKPLIIVSSFVMLVLVTLMAFYLNELGSTSSVGISYSQLTQLGDASGPAISPDGRIVAYTTGGEDMNRNKVIIQDIKSGYTNEIMQTTMCQSLSWSPDGTQLAVWAAMVDLNVSTFIVPRLGGTPRNLGNIGLTVWSPEGTHLASIFFPSKGIRITNILTKESKTIPLKGDFQWICDLAWAPSGDHLLFLTNSGTRNWAIRTIRIDGDQQNTVAESDFLLSPCWSPKGDFIYYSEGQEGKTGIWKIPFSAKSGKSSGLAKSVLSSDGIIGTFSMSADGKVLVYERSNFYTNIWHASIDGIGKDQNIRIKQLTNDTTLNMLPSISPDGKSVAFVEEGNIQIMPLTGGSPEQITFLKSLCWNPVWSPDGKEIVFGVSEKGNSRICKVSTTGGTIHQFTTPRGICTWASLEWAPGPFILYQVSGNKNTCVLDPQSENVSLLIEEEEGWIISPRYSPDGEFVAIAWNRPGHGYHIWVISLKDFSAKKLLPKDVIPIGWSSDGKWLYVYNHVPQMFKISLINIETSLMKTLIETPVSKEVGELERQSIRMSPDEKNFVFSAKKNLSDIWLVENFDPDIK